jgi:hypothetical protein
MRAITNGTRLALTLTGATALATAATTTAYATGNDGLAPATTTLQASTLDLHTPLNADVYRAFLDAKLARVASYVNAIQAKVAAIPSDTVLVGSARFAAKAKLAKAAYLSRLLDAIPDSGTYAPTAAERATIAAIQADLAAITAKVKALLANQPAVVTPTMTKVAARTVAVKDLSLRRHVCDGHWGDWDRDGWSSDRWNHDGWSSWWHH